MLYCRQWWNVTTPFYTGINGPDEPADDDGGWVPEHGALAGGAIAAPPAQNQPALDAGVAVPKYAPAKEDTATPPAHDEPTPDAGAATPQQDPEPVTAEQRVTEDEQYLDRSVDPETLSIPLVVFPGLYKVIPTRETSCAGWSAFVDAIAPTPAPVANQKSDVPYVIAGALQEAPLSEAAQKELRRLGKHAETGKARSNKHFPSLGPGFLLDDDGDVLAREAVLRTLGCAACIYTSYSYGAIKKGAADPSKGGRVALCLNRPYRPDEHKPLWYGISHLLGGASTRQGKPCPSVTACTRGEAMTPLINVSRSTVQC
jgi:hypothetical protein